MTYVDDSSPQYPPPIARSTGSAEAAAVVFKEHGALRVVECWGDDVPEGKLTSFPMAVKRKEDETVVFSWIPAVPAGAHEGMKKVMADRGCSRTPTRCPSTASG
jgi:uncharacterized protein YbaA (DUF1428 family)